MSTLLISVFIQSLLFFPLALGIYLSFSVLKIPDLTVEGSFVTGASLYAKSIILGKSALFSFSVALMGGAFIGLLVGLMQKRNKVQPLITGILMIFILCSINLVIMGRPNISLLGKETSLGILLKQYENYPEIIVKLCLLIVVGCSLSLLMTLLLRSRIGLFFRAFADNPKLLETQGVFSEGVRVLGLSLSNLLAALCGVMSAQFYGYADVNMGFGFALVGIGVVIIGKQLTRYVLNMDILALLLGVLFYFSLVNGLIRYHVDPHYLKVFIGLTLYIFFRFLRSNHQGYEVCK